MIRSRYIFCLPYRTAASAVYCLRRTTCLLPVTNLLLKHNLVIDRYLLNSRNRQHGPPQAATALLLTGHLQNAVELCSIRDNPQSCYPFVPPLYVKKTAFAASSPGKFNGTGTVTAGSRLPERDNEKAPTAC